MAEIRSFPNNKDEYIGAEDVMRWLHGRSSGVFGADGNAAVSPVLDTMAVTVSDGNGWLTNASGDGIVWWVDSEAKSGIKLELAVDIADAVLPRIDRVAVSWQTTNYVALPEVIILKGTPASNPTAPALTNDNMTRQISLAAIRIPAGATTIDASMITDERLNSAVCGIVTEQVGVDTSVMEAQFKSFFEKTIAEQNAYIEAQAHSWEAFFENVQNDTVIPVPNVSDTGKVVKVNPTGDGYILGGVEIPVTSVPPKDCDVWVDPNEETDPMTPEQFGIGDYVVAQGINNGLRWRKWNSGLAECWYAFSEDRYYSDTEGEENNYVDSFTANLPFNFGLAQAFTNAYCEEDNGDGTITTLDINTRRPYIAERQLIVDFDLPGYYGKFIYINIDVYAVGTWSKGE